MNGHRIRALPLVIALACGCGLATAQTASTAQHTVTANTAGHPATATRTDNTAASQTTAKLSHADREFMEDAAKGSLFEVQAGKLAAARASDSRVKEFGNRLAQDHQKSGDELAQLAEAKDVALPDQPGWLQRHELKKLGTLSGTQFDRRFARDGVKDHEKDVKNFEKAIAKVKDPDVKAWAQKTLATLREHLAIAQKLPEVAAGSAAAVDHPVMHKPAG